MLVNRIHEVRTLFDQYPHLIRQPNNTNQTDVFELEVKYGYYAGKKFRSSVPYIHYERLLNRLRSSPDFSVLPVEISTVTQIDGHRKISIITEGDGREEIIYQIKEKIRDFDFPEYDIRMTLNVERRQDESTFPTTGNRIIRERVRTSFVMNNGLIGVDMSEIMMIDESGTTRNSYEVEIEYLGDQNNFNVFVRETDNICKILRDTNVIYTTQDRNQLNFDIGSLLPIFKSNKRDPCVKPKKESDRILIDKKVLVDARNIKKRDLVYGGIVGNYKLKDVRVLSQPRREGVPQNGTNYLLTFKADGWRKMLIIHITGIWLVYPPFEFNLVISPTFNITGLTQLLTSYNGTVLDGEYVIPKQPNGVDYWYLAFDCLSFCGLVTRSGVQNRSGVSIQDQSYIVRRERVLAVSNAVRNSILTVDVKESREIRTPSDFFTSVGDFLDRRDELPYNQDGLMFIPIDVKYNPHSEEYPLRDRTLTQHPDTCKWKEGSDITIDFAVKWVNSNSVNSNSVNSNSVSSDIMDRRIELYVYDETRCENVLFVGNLINPLTSDMIDHGNELTWNVPSGTIVEYEWVLLPQVNATDPKGILRPRKIRTEKSSANKLSIALDDWEDVINPITEDDIRGINLTMTFSYHNRIKKALYNMLTFDHNKGNRNGINLLDIGGGEGGDVAKWLGLTDPKNPQTTGFVVTVEPNVNNTIELNRRVDLFGMRDKVRIVETGGEDTVAITNAVREFIPGGKVDAVSLMLSMSFFWASSEHLDALVKTIVTNLKPGGKIIFLTINGDVIEQLFEPALGGPHITDLTIATANLHLYPKFADQRFGRPLDFILPGTIVEEQREYLVHLQDFRTRLAVYGINIEENYRAEREKLLSSTNKLYSSMYSYGYAVSDEITLNNFQQTNTEITNLELPNLPIPINSSPTQMNSDLNNLPILTIVNTPLPKSPTPQLPISSPIITSPINPSLVPPTINPSLVPPTINPSLINSPSLTPTINPSLIPPSLVPPTINPSLVPPTLIPPRIGMSLVPPKLINPSLVPMGTPPVPKFQIEHNQLRWLTVTYTGQRGRIIQGPAIGDDTYAPLTCTWYENLVRIATIGDGSCFIHAVLKAFYRAYQENNNASYRLGITAQLRRDLALKLGNENPQYPGYTYWATSGRGAFPRLVMQEIVDENLIHVLNNVDFTLAGLQRLFNSTEELGEEMYGFVSDILNIDIYVLRATSKDLFPQQHTHNPNNNPRPGIIIIGNDYHYEVLAVNKPDGFQTVFLQNDPFRVAITTLFAEHGGFNDIRNVIPYDPDENFIRDYIGVVSSAPGANIPESSRQIFLPDDPFRHTLERLLPRIEQALLFQQNINPTINPIIERMNTVLQIMEANTYSSEVTNRIREVVQARFNPDVPQDLNTIISTAETDGLLDHDTVVDFLNTNLIF